MTSQGRGREERVRGKVTSVDSRGYMDDARLSREREKRGAAHLTSQGADATCVPESDGQWSKSVTVAVILHENHGHPFTLTFTPSVMAAA